MTISYRPHQPLARFVDIVRQRTRPYRWWLARPWLGRNASQRYSKCRSVCLFIGYPRSGHTILGSLIDAHPDAMIGHEFDAMLFLRCGFHLRETFPLMEAASRRAAGRGRFVGGYNYAVPEMWQGRARDLLVIGDKHGEATSAEFHKNPWVLDRLLQEQAIPVRFLHVVRHPFDNIATISKRPLPGLGKWIAGGVVKKSGDSLLDAENYYFALVESVMQTLARAKTLTIHYESLVAEPHKTLANVCHFLGLSAPTDYLDACASIILPQPKLTRHEIIWPPGTQDRIRERCAAVPFLQGYFDS